jgi:hypothetical protein
MGRSIQQDAADDREIERIMSMKEEDLVASMGGREAYDLAVEETRAIFERAVAEAERRTGKKFDRD